MASNCIFLKCKRFPNWLQRFNILPILFKMIFTQSGFSGLEVVNEQISVRRKIAREGDGIAHGIANELGLAVEVTNQRH